MHVSPYGIVTSNDDLVCTLSNNSLSTLFYPKGTHFVTSIGLSTAVKHGGLGVISIFYFALIVWDMPLQELWGASAVSEMPIILSFS